MPAAAPERRPRPSPALLLNLLLCALGPASSAANAAVPQSTIAKAARALAEPWQTSFPRMWDLRERQMAAVSVGGVPLLSTPHGPLLRHRARLLSPAAAARGLAHLGPAASLRRFLHHAAGVSSANNDDHHHRRPLRIGVVGGSISWGSAVERGVEDWPSVVLSSLRSYYPHSEFAPLANGCVPATPASFTSACLQNLVPRDADLVFVEFAVNESGAGEKKGEPSFEGVQRAAARYERLLRKLLALPRRPAVVLVHLPAVGMAMSASHPWRREYNQTAEDALAVVGAYYDCPVVSLRQAIWRLARDGPEFSRHGLNFSDFYSDADAKPYDFIHPLGPGHRAIADLVLHALGEVAMGLALRPWSADLLEGGGGSDGAEALAPLSPPLYKNNLADGNVACAHGGGLAAHVESAEGFELVDEGKAPKQKVGYVAWQPGARLVLRVDLGETGAEGEGAAEAEEQRADDASSSLAREFDAERAPGANSAGVAVQLAYLKSYKHMGRASVECLGGCSCGGGGGVGESAGGGGSSGNSSAIVLDAHHDIWQTTVYLLPLAPKPSAGDPQAACRIAVTVLDGTSSPDRGHKFKITGLMATRPLEGTVAEDEAGRVLRELAHEALQHEKWLGQVNAGSAPAAEVVLRRRRVERAERERGAMGANKAAAVAVAATSGGGGAALPRSVEAQRRAQQQQVLREEEGEEEAGRRAAAAGGYGKQP